MNQKRRDFLTHSAAILGGVLLSACGDDDGTTMDAGTDTGGGMDVDMTDTGTPDTGTPDTGTPDTGATDTGTPDTGGGTECLSPATSIGGNHGHTMEVSAADVEAGAEKTYDIQGSSGHPHSVTITADQFATLASELSLSVESTTDSGHSHTIMVTCAVA